MTKRISAELLGQFGRSLIDLSLPLRPGMFPIKESSDVRTEVLAGYDGPFGLFETQLRMSCHAGTHIDYPSHVDPSGGRAFAFDPFRDGIFPAHTCTLAYHLAFPEKRGRVKDPSDGMQWGDEISAEEIAGWFAAFDTAYPGFRHEAMQGALLQTGWNDRYFDTDFWRRCGPTLSDDGARLLMARRLRYLASDFTFTFEPGRTHDIVMRGSDRFQVENLCNLGALSSPVVGLLVAPLKIEGAEGLPCRVYGIDIEPASLMGPQA